MTRIDLIKLAMQVAGGQRQLEHFVEQRKVKKMTTDLIRQLFITPAKELVSEMSAAELGEICELGENLGANEYRDSTVVTHGTNAWSAVFLSTSDSGKTLLQKIAVASLLATMIKIINEGMPEFQDSWFPIELVSCEAIDKMQARGEVVSAVLGW